MLQSFAEAQEGEGLDAREARNAWNLCGAQFTNPVQKVARRSDSSQNILSAHLLGLDAAEPDDDQSGCPTHLLPDIHGSWGTWPDDDWSLIILGEAGV